VAPSSTIIEIDHPPEVAFPYVIDPRTFPAWQPAVLEGRMDREAVRVGAICTTVRKIGGDAREIHSRITEYDPTASLGRPRHRRGIVSVDVQPLNSGARSRVAIVVDFEGHGIGKLLVVTRRPPPGRQRDAVRHEPPQGGAGGELGPRARNALCPSGCSRSRRRIASSRVGYEVVAVAFTRTASCVPA
jgi:Polyketide cyclase / dehydrase and lipid transport